MTNYSIRKSGGQIIVQGGQTNTSDTVLSIPGIGVRIEADPLYQDLVTMLENSANYTGTGPTPAITGQLWYDVNNTRLKVYSGTGWSDVGVGIAYSDVGNGLSIVSSLGPNATGRTSLNFKTIIGDNTTASITANGNTLTVSCIISPTNVGTGIGNIYKDGWGFRRIKSGDSKIVVAQTGDDIVITTLAVGSSDIGGFISDGRNIPDGGDGVAVYKNNSGSSMLFRKLKGVRDIVNGVAGPGIGVALDSQDQILISAQSLLKVGEAEINHGVSVPDGCTGCVDVYAGMQDTDIMIKKIKVTSPITITDTNNTLTIGFDSSALHSVTSYCANGVQSLPNTGATVNPNTYGPFSPNISTGSNITMGSVNIDNVTNFTTTLVSMAKMTISPTTTARTDYITAHCLQVCDYGLINGASSHVVLQVNGVTVYDEQRWCGYDTNIYYTYNAQNGEVANYELLCKVDDIDFANASSQAGVQFRQINIVALSIV